MLLNPLRPGSVVDIIAPASRASNVDLQNGVRALRELGLQPRVPKNLFAKSVLFSNSDEVRLQHLRKALFAPDSDLIWCVRGGYGALRLLPAMARWKAPRHPKLLLGYSDITTIHTFLNQRWGWPTLHGPMLDRFGGERMGLRERRELLEVLFGRVDVVEFDRLRPLNAAAAGTGARRGRVVRGSVRGGNLAVLQSSVGTPNQIDTDGAILFLEDTGERPHRVDRMLVQFDQAGLFARAKAIVFGYFQLGDPRDRRDLWTDVIGRFAAGQRLPVLAGLPVGHDAKLQRTLPLGSAAELRLGERPSLKVTTGVRTD